MQLKMPEHVASCQLCRPSWVAWRDADYDPSHPTQPGGGPTMDGRTAHADRRKWQEDLQRSQCELVAELCSAGKHGGGPGSASSGHLGASHVG
jgi:hypothetical protein